MPSYSYIAKSRTGESKRGILNAKNEYEVARILRQEGYILIQASIEEKEKKKKKFSITIPLLGSVSLTEKIMFARNLRVMVSAGVSLPRVLKILSSQSKSKKMQKALLGVSEEVEKGKSFSDSLSKYPSVFSEVFYNMIKVGEEAGTLEDVLEVLTGQMEREYELKSKIKGALIYPAVILSAMIGIGILMLIVVIPKLAETFNEFGIELPITTRIVIAVGTSLAKFWYLIPLVIVFLIIFIQLFIKTKTGKFIVHTLFIKTPLISPFVKKINAAYTIRTLSSLIAAGVPIVRALEVVSGSLTNIYYKKAMAEASEWVKEGKKLAEVFRVHKNIYPDLVIQMVEIGEETGETTKVLQQLAGFFEEEVTRATKNLSSVIEPILMLIIGAAVGFFAVSMLQPIYSMIGSFQ